MSSRINIKGISPTIPSGLLIGGKWVQGRGEVLESVNPDTEEVIAEVCSSGLNVATLTTAPDRFARGRQ